MYELILLKDDTFYINSPSKVGIYRINEEEIYLIDSGNDKDAARKVDKHINENKWKLKGIINTHSNADHVGGNKLLQTRHNCEIISTSIENAFTKHPILEPSFLYGGYPFKSIKNKFMMAEASEPTSDINNIEIEGLSFIELGGHFFDMIGVITKDKVAFLGDSLFPEEIINKYHVFFIYDVRLYLETLEKLKSLEADIYLPSHCEPMNDIHNLINLNKMKIEEIINRILEICNVNSTFETILKFIFDIYSLKLDANQYVLVGSTIKSYLSYMYELNLISYNFIENKMFWEKN